MDKSKKLLKKVKMLRSIPFANEGDTFKVYNEDHISIKYGIDYPIKELEKFPDIFEMVYEDRSHSIHTYRFNGNERISFHGLIVGDVLECIKEKVGMHGDFMPFRAIDFHLGKEYPIERVSDTPYVIDEDGCLTVPSTEFFKFKRYKNHD